MNQIAKFSKQIWRPKDVVTEPVTPSWKVPDLRQLPRETPAEVDAFSRNPIGKSLNDAVRTGRLDLPRSGKTPILGDLLSNDSIRSQMASLSDTISQVPKGALQKASIESLSQMAPLNQLAHDRLAALPPETISKVLKSGPPQQSTLFLQRMASEISGRPVSPGHPDIPQLEEIFHAVQTPQGDAKVLGRTLINDEWYHFGTTSGTSPLQQASTWIAPTRLMASPNPAAQKDLNAGRVLKDVQGLFQGPWAPYVKGAGLLTKPHTVDIRHADQDGIKSVLATLDTITGTLKTIQSVTKGIQQGLELIGMLGSLGSLGSYMQIFNQMKLPGSPGELITALITGKGINPNKPPAPPTADQTGSGKNGVLVTKGGAAAKAIGDGLLAKAQAEAEKKKQREPAKDVGSGAAKHEKTRELTPTEKKRVNRAISKIEQSQFGKTEEGRRVVNALNQKLKNGDIEFANANSPGGGHYHPTNTHGTEAGKDHEHKIHIEAGYLYSTNPHDLEGHLVHEATHALDDADFPTHRDSIENEVRAYENAAVYLGEVDPSNPKVADYYSSANRDEFEKKIRGYENGKLYQDNTDGRYPAPSKIPTKPPTPPVPGSEPIDQIDYGLKVDAYNSYIQWKKEQEFEQSRNDAFPQGTPPHPISPLSNPLKK